MGLDQYAYYEQDGEQLPIADWRKHNRLQGWMEQRWVDKGSPGTHTEGNPMGDFNCVPLELNAQDIEDLEWAIENFDLPETAGFFFGQDSYFWENEDGEPYPENDYFYKEQDIEFVQEAKKALTDGHKVFYNSWY
jgi:hypothetical protein